VIIYFSFGLLEICIKNYLDPRDGKRRETRKVICKKEKYCKGFQTGITSIINLSFLF
jgi:hypothetical protein